MLAADKYRLDFLTVWNWHIIGCGLSGADLLNSTLEIANMNKIHQNQEILCNFIIECG